MVRMLAVLFLLLPSFLYGQTVPPMIQPYFPAPQNQVIPPVNQNAPVLGIGASPFFLTSKLIIHQDGKTDISLSENLAFPREFTVWRFDIFAGSAPLKITYEFTPSIRGSGQGKLPVSLIVNEKTFGPKTTATGSTDTNDIVSVEAQAARHRLEFAYVWRAGANTLLVPRIGGQFYPTKFMIKNIGDSAQVAEWSSTPSFFSAGLAFEQDFPNFAVVVAADYLTGKQATGYQAELSGTLTTSNRRIPVFLSAGYYIQAIQWRFAGGSVDSDIRGPFLRAEWRF